MPRNQNWPLIVILITCKFSAKTQSFCGSCQSMKFHSIKNSIIWFPFHFFFLFRWFSQFTDQICELERMRATVEMDRHGCVVVRVHRFSCPTNENRAVKKHIARVWLDSQNSAKMNAYKDCQWVQMTWPPIIRFQVSGYSCVVAIDLIIKFSNVSCVIFILNWC